MVLSLWCLPVPLAAAVPLPVLWFCVNLWACARSLALSRLPPRLCPWPGTSCVTWTTSSWPSPVCWSWASVTTCCLVSLVGCRPAWSPCSSKKTASLTSPPVPSEHLETLHAWIWRTTASAWSNLEPFRVWASCRSWRWRETSSRVSRGVSLPRWRTSTSLKTASLRWSCPLSPLWLTCKAWRSAETVCVPFRRALLTAWLVSDLWTWLKTCGPAAVTSSTSTAGCWVHRWGWPQTSGALSPPTLLSTYLWTFPSWNYVLMSSGHMNGRTSTSPGSEDGYRLKTGLSV